MFKVVIGIAGKKRHGKSTLARKVQGLLNCAHYCFAWPLKSLILEALKLNLDPAKGEDDILKEAFLAVPASLVESVIETIELELKNAGLKPLTASEKLTLTSKISWAPISQAYRWLLQYVGTEIFRKRDSNFWTERFKQEVAGLREQHKVLLVSDVRFPNEVECLRSLGEHCLIYKIVYLDAPKSDDQHLSEVLIDQLEVDKVYELPHGMEHIGRAAKEIVREVVKLL